ncbi:MAG: hypothetical protein KatS3mg038_1706 [Candidatus Kapaibacterium sp.]|nr:MAG: hypothetical protein KatS3mg038_1706 [Candidatus Kapabacteria bacterium]
MNGLFRFSARILAAACTLLLIGSSALRAQTAPSSPSTSPANSAASAQAMVGSSGLEFLENKGQVVDDQGRKAERVRFTAHSNGAKLFFMPDRIAHVFIEASGPGAKHEPGKGISSKELDQTRIRYQRVDMELVGANQHVNLRGEGVLPGVTNFFTAAAGPDGITGVRSFSAIVYENVYPNIDLVLKARGKGMKAEFIVRPGGDPSQIRLRVSNAEGIELTNEGGYRIRTALGVITEDAPYSFVRTANGEQEVAVRFRLDGDVIAFDVPSYDRSQTLVIDPGRDWSTFHGGNAEDVGTGIAVQRSFNPANTTPYIYICGYTAGGTFPIVSASQGTYGGGAYDAFVAAYQYGGTRQYSTYFGGSNDDRAWGITADASGQVWVVGQSRSAAWGGFFTNANAGDVDAFVARFNSSGSPQAARFVGGTNDDYFLAVAYDGTNLTCGGYTASPGLATAGVFQTTYNGLYCGMIARLPATALNAITWLTYYGNNTGSPNGQETYVTSLSPRGTSGDVWVGGYTNSPNTAQAIATTGSFNTVVNNNGSGTTTGSVNFDGFVALMTSSGGRTAATYYGAVQNDRVLGVAADPLDATAVIAVGRTNSINAGNLIASGTGFNTVLNNGSNSTAFDDGFVTRLTVSGTTLGRDWGSYWGSTADDYLTSVAVDDNNVNEAGSNTISDGRGGKIFVAGYTAGSSGDFATYNFDGSFNSNQGGYDAVWSRILRAPGGTPTVEYSVITGGSGNDIANGIAVDNQRNVHLVGSATAGGGNLAAGGAQTTYGGGASDAFAIKWCDPIRPNAPAFSTNGIGGPFTATSVCVQLNSTATGFVTTSGPYPNVFSGTQSGSCVTSAVQVLAVRLTNAVQGMQYSIWNGSAFFPITADGTTTQQLTTDRVLALTDGNIFVTIPASAFTSATTYNVRWVAGSNYAGTSPCRSEGIDASLTVNALPANDAISQSAPGTDNNGAAAPGSTFNFYVCGGSTNNFTVTGGGGLTYNWCVMQNGSVTTAPTVANANTQTVSITPNTTAAQRDTLYLRVRLTNANGCAIEYQAALYVLPVVNIQNGIANEATNANANPQNLCVNSSGTVTAPSGYSYQDSGPHSLVNTYNESSNVPGGGTTTGSDPVTAVTQAYAWTTNAPQGVINSVTFSSPSNANGGTVSVTYGGGGFSSMANPQPVTFTLTESYTGGGINSCSRQATYTVNFYPQPTVSVTPSPAGPVCEGTNVTFTISVTPSSVNSGAISLTLNAGSQTGATVTASTGLSPAWTSGTTYTGNFTSSTITVTVNPGTVTAAYDAQGSISLTVNSLTNGATTLTCGIPSAVTSSTVTITQNPDQVSVATGTYNPGGNPALPTLSAASPPVPATLQPSSSTPAANTTGSTSACTWDNVNGYAQEYRYAIQEISSSQTPNANDTYAWQFTLPLGLGVTVVADANGNSIGTTYPGGGTFTLGPTVNNPPNPERRGLRLSWNNTTPSPLTATITVIQINNQSPGTCQRTMNQLQVTVRPLPQPFALSQYTWQGASAGSSHNVCENTNIPITISGLANGTQVQLYQINQVANSGGAGYAYNNSTTLPSAIQTAGGAGTVSFTINSGSVTAGANLPAWQDITVQFVAVDPNNCGRITGLVSPTLRVWDTPANPLVSGPSPVCPNKTTDPNALVQATGFPALTAHPYTISNTGSYPPGTTFQWQLRDASNNILTPGTDYDITLSSSGGYNNNQADVRFGKHLVAPTYSPLQWYVSVTFPSSSGGCTLPFTATGMNVTVLPVTDPDIAGNTTDPNGVASLSLPPGLCSGQQATYAAAPGASSYLWSIVATANGSPAWPSAPTIVGTSGNTVTIDWPAFSDVPLRWPRVDVVTTWGVNNCPEGDTQTVYILPVPQAGPIEMVQDGSTPWPDSACVFNGENSHIRAFTVPKSTSYTIANVSWSFTNGLTAIYSYGTSPMPYAQPGANDTVRVQFYGTGWEHVDATVTTTNGCSSTASLDFMVYPPPSPAISGPTSVCHNSTHTYTATPYVANDTYIWEIIPSSGGTITPTTNQSVINVTWNGSPNTTYTIRLTEVSPLGCTTRVYYTVTVNPNPTPAISGPTTICAGQNYVYTTQDNSPNNSYAWSFTANTAGATFVSGQNTASATVTTTTTGSFSLQVVETVVATSCTGSATYGPVTVISSPTPSISRTSPAGPLGQACVGQMITYETPASGNSYQWSVTGGGSIVGASTNNTVQIQWSATGMQTITLVETQGSCSTTVTQQVNVVPQPSPVVSGPSVACSGSGYSYTYSTANNTGSTYNWTLGAGVNAIGPTTNASVQVTFSGSTLNSVNRTLSVTETNSANCSATSPTMNVSVTSTPTPSITGTTPVCQNTTATYSDANAASQPPATTYNWSVTGGTITGAATGSSVTVLWTGSGSQTVTLVATNNTNSANCQATATFNVAVNPAPTAYNVTTSTPSICVGGGPVTINLSGSQSGASYQLRRNGTNIGAAVSGTGSPLQFTDNGPFSSATTYNYDVVATLGTCTATMNGTATVVVNPLPTPSVSGPTSVCSGQSYQYSTPNASPRSWTWTVPTGWSITNGQGTSQITVTAGTSGGSVSVLETNTSTGCSATSSVTVSVTAPPTVYNVSPSTASVCRPNTGTTTFNVQLSGSQLNVNYQVMLGSTPLGSAVAGTGSAINLPITIGTGGNITATGTYTLTVQATAQTGACSGVPTMMSGSVNLTVNPTPSPVVNGPTTVCSGQSYTYQTTNNSGSTYNWTVPTGWTITAGQGTSQITVTSGTAGGNITVTETVSSTGCSATSPALAVSVTSTPAPTITGSTTPCAGTTQTYTTASGFTSYSWSISPATAGTITSGGTTNIATIQWGTNAVSATVTVTVANGACTGQGSLAVNVQAAPTAYNVGTTTPNACSNVSNNVTITLSGSQSGVTYTINRSPGGSQGTLSGTGSPLSFTQTVSTAGTYGYTITATNGAGCTSTMNGTATVVVTDPPTATVSGASAVCSGSSATYTATPASGVTYAWSVSGSGNSVQSTTANQATILFGMTSGTATVTVVATNSSGCQGTASQSVTVNALPLNRPVAISPSAICAAGGIGSNVTSATITVGSNVQPVEANTTYQLLQGMTVVATQTTGASPGNTVTFTVGSLSAGTYVYSVRAISSTTPACTTTMTQTVTLTVNPLPTPAVTGNTTPCVGQTVTYTTQNNTGSTYAWTWAPVADFTPAGPTNTYQITGTWGASGSKSITVTETNSAGCGQTNTLNVSVQSAPTPTITASQANPICGGQTVTFTTTPSGASSYTWTVGSNGTLQSGQGTQSITVTWANTPSSYSSSVSVVVNVGGCTGNASYTVNVNPQATPTISGPASICSGQSGTYSTPLTTGRTYSWSTTATPPGMTPFSQSGVNLNSVTINWVNTSSSPFVATVQVVESAGGVCTGTATYNVTVNPLPNTAITGPTSVCQGQTVTYSHSPALTGHSFAWTVTNAQSWSGQGTGAITVTWGNTNGTVALTVTNNSTGCTANATNSPLAVTVNPNPTPTISGNVNPCAGSTQTYSTQTGMTSYSWSITPASAGTIVGPSNQSSVNIQWSNTQVTATLTVQVNNSGCTGQQSVTINVQPKPTPAISGVSQTCPGVDRTFTTPYTAGNSYSWTVSYTPGYIVTGGSTTSNTITVRFNSPGASSATATLQVTETSPYGCQGTATQTVTVQPAPQPVITGNTNVCGYLAQYDGMPINNTETYVVSDANGINYSTANVVWTLPAGGGTFTGASSGTGVTTVTVQWDEPTAAATVGRQIAVQVTLGAPTNCTGQTTSNVQVNWNPKPSISGPRAWCDNSVYTANSTSASQSGLATYSVQVPVTPVLPSGSSRTYNWAITPASAGTIVSGQGTPSVQVSWTSSLANTPVNAVLSVTETINYLNASATPTNKFCGITDTFRVVINPIPKPVITSPNNGITGPNGQGPCGRDSYTYQVAADANSSYQWVVSGGTIVGSSTSNVINVQWNNVTSPTPGYVGVTQTFLTPATMCSTYVQQNLTIQVKPSPKVTGPTVLCQQTTNGTNVGNYTVQTVVAGNTYQWTAEPASLVISSSTSGAQNQNFQVTWGGTSSTPLTARVIVLETNPVSGCSQRDTLTITLNPNPTPVITSTTGGLNPNGVCAGSTHIYQTQFNTGNSYLWTVTGGTISGANTNNQVTVVWGSAGSGTISVREQVGTMFGSGCWTQVTANVTIRPLPNPVITGPATVCRYTQQSYAVQTPNVNNTYQWTITNGQIVGASTNPSVTVLWYGVPSGTIAVTETTPPSQGSCSNTASLNVTINPKPAPVISGPPAPPVCVNSTQTYSTPLNTGNTYLWTVTGGTIGGVATNNTVTVTWTTVGNGTISVKETNTLGCDTTVSRTIPVNALPSVTITPSGPTVICNGQSVTLLATPGFVSYSWNTGETTPNITVTQSGTYLVTVVDQNGCSNNSNSISVTVQNVTPPQIQASGPTTFCQGSSVTLSITGTNIQGYAWSNGATTSSITVTTSGSYWCEVTYNNGCKARTDIIQVTVVPRPTVSITANGPTTFCEGGSVVLDAGAGFATYAWSNGSQTVGTNRTLTVTQAGNYTVTVTNNIGCSATSQPVTVTVYPKPAPQIQASGPTEFCEGGSVTLDAGAGFASYQWSNGATTRTITVTQQGSYTVTVTDQNNCSGTSQPVVVTVYPKPAKPTITQTGGTLTSSSAAQYQWYYNGEPISGATDRSYTLVRGRDNSGYYKVRIRDNNGCENTSDSIYIDITPVEVAGDNIGIQFMPNPTSGELRIVFGDAINVESAHVIVRNLVGREMLSLELGAISAGTAKTLDLANLPNGVYMVEVILQNGMRTIGRVTKVD